MGTTPEPGQVWIRKAQIRDVQQNNEQESDDDIFHVLVSNGDGKFNHKEETIKRHLFTSDFIHDQKNPGTYISSVIIDHVGQKNIYICKIKHDNGDTTECSPKPKLKQKFYNEYHLPQPKNQD